jgi:TubC N-terminal docking domain
MTFNQLLAQLNSLDVELKSDGHQLHYKALKGVLTPDLRQALQQHKAEMLTYLKAKDSKVFLLDLPFPMGYGGLPQAQVEAAEVISDKFGIKDPVHRKYNVLSWVRGYYQDIGENCGEHYQAIKAEQLRLSEILRGGQS